MKINAKDVASGALLIGIAVIGLWLNQDHTLGTARRMGPGYMPMMTFWLLMGLGAIVLLLGLFNGPDRLERWAWRELTLILASLVVFALLLESGGLFLSIAGLVGVAALGDRTHRPLGVLGLMVFLMALCWFVFIRELDIRVNLFPVFLGMG
ncbi:tripartite tricarboxylate transporter TctB family protein [Roseomonas stagni]|uniref:Tripartite tricarboxylate transporter TctB family protein n=1 Tax=Falsiroseomonas algicola TaxID=2716930 RepID=A0A6M1LGH3_9PROT|nr:tripartite tricarboxylate transporter TctB family protein [Falsiroseomonas algicola]NGM19301.1 tripartite tricarboxylate transporter TctB family protein [Falsiroseomonas algicola]